MSKFSYEDLNGMAARIVATATNNPKKVKSTPERRIEVAKKAAAARWANR